MDSIRYECEGSWLDLESLIRSGFAPEARPWKQTQGELSRIRVRYGNGLVVYVNRDVEALVVKTPSAAVTLPQYGWIAYRESGGFLAYSALHPGSSHRVDFLEDSASGLRFLNPRGAAIGGSSRMRLLERGTVLWEVDVSRGVAIVGGKERALDPIEVPLHDLHFDFSAGLEGLRPSAGILRVESCSEGTRLTVVSPDPQMRSVPLLVRGESGDVLELRMSANAGEMGQLYFATSEEGISERQVVRFPVVADGLMRLIRIPVGDHPRWRSGRIEGLRLDPIHGPPAATVVLRSLNRVRAGP